MAEPERIRQTIEWTAEPLRNEKRIKQKVDRVLYYCRFHGFDLVGISKMPGSPGLRTMRRWCAENLYGIGKEYGQIMRERAINRMHASLQEDLRKIEARVARENRTPDRTP